MQPGQHLLQGSQQQGSIDLVALLFQRIQTTGQ